LTGGPPLAVAAGSAVGAVAVVVLAARLARRAESRRRDLATALAVLRGELDAGRPFVDALLAARERAGAAADAFDLGSGTAASDPIRPDAVAHARRCLTTGAGLVAVAGAPWSAVAAGIARDVAARDAREREIGSALAGARASTVVLAGLPLLGLGLAATLGADPVAFLLHDPAGRWVLAAGATLDLLGVAVSSAVASRAAR
ncbi:type II secretion system F family protein, partial [Jatrophihabitans sp. YIM 134969]